MNITLHFDQRFMVKYYNKLQQYSKIPITTTYQGNVLVRFYRSKPTSYHQYITSRDTLQGFSADNWNYVGYLPNDIPLLEEFRYKVSAAPVTVAHTQIIADINNHLKTLQGTPTFTLPTGYSISQEVIYGQSIVNHIPTACNHEWADTGMKVRWCKHCNAEQRWTAQAVWENV